MVIIEIENKWCNLKFEIEIRGSITQLYDLSATGKTLFVNTVDNHIKGLKSGDACLLNNILDKAFVYDFYKDSLDSIIELKDRFIIIDRADFISYDKEFSKAIIQGSRLNKNYYLLISRRNLNVGLSPNYYAQFVRDGNIIKTYYEFSEVGWY